MVAGFVIVNFTRAGDHFHDAVHDISGPVYLLFFTLTGATMDIAVLRRNIFACLLLFATRCVCIFAGSWVGGYVSQQPAHFRTKYWMAFMTQAGVTLGLAQTVSAHFTWGPDFTASIVAVVVCNQIVGPPLFKRVLGPAGVGEQHHSYDPQRVRHASQIAKLGKTEVPATVRPQARGALVVAEEGNADATLVSERLRALGWEVLLADPSLSISTTTALERQTYNERSTRGLSVLPPSVREEVARFRLAAKPWEALLSARSLPTMKLRPYDRHGHVIAAAALPSPGISAAAVAAAAVGAPYTSGREHAHSDATDGGGGRPRRSSVTGAPPSPRDAAGPSPLAAGALAAGAAARRKGSGASGEPSGLGPRRTITQPPTEPVEREGRGVRRTYSFDPNGKRHLSMPTLLRSPPKPEMPENEESNPKRYADCMRLLWLASSMRSVDVVVSLLPTDDENIAICSLVNDMGPMLLALHKHQRSSPQVLLPLGDETKHAGLRELIARGALLVPPFVVPVARTMPSLICEVLHPAAHWSGSLEGGPWSDALGAAGAGDDESTRLLPSPRPDKASDDPSYATPAKTPAAKAAAATEGALARGERRKSPLALDPPRAPSPFEPGATPFFHPAHPSRLSRSEVHPPPAPDLL